MKYVTYRKDGKVSVGILDDQFVVNPLEIGQIAATLGSDASKCFSDMQSVIQNARQANDIARQALKISQAENQGRHALRDIALLAPMRPSTILCAGSNYGSHNAEKISSDTSGKEPEFFIKTADCLADPGQGIPYDPILTRKLDGEVELAVVIGLPGRHIPVEQALQHVFGYTIINDVSARDRQVRLRPDGTSWYELGRGKVFDCSAPMGPCIVTADEIPDPQTLGIRSRVNDELRQNGNTADMIWSVAELIHAFSINLTLRPGMVIITGTPSGTAWSTDSSLGGKWSGGNGIVPAKGYLQPGDRVECEIDGIGLLLNTVIDASTAA